MDIHKVIAFSHVISFNIQWCEFFLISFNQSTRAVNIDLELS